jgi:hypothetical protein
MEIIEAQQGLATLIRNTKLDDELLDQAIMSSGTIEKPHAIISDALWENVNLEIETSGTSLLALGSNSSFAQQSGNDTLSTSIQQRLLSKLGTTDDVMISYNLLALANSITDDASKKQIVFDSVKDYMSNENTHIRQSVYKVFGQLDSLQSRDLLLSALRDETSSEVKKDIIDSIKNRKDKADSEVIDTVEIAMNKEKDKRIYNKLIDLLGAALETNQKAGELLEKQLNTPLPKDMKKKIYEALY